MTESLSRRALLREAAAVAAQMPLLRAIAAPPVSDTSAEHGQIGVVEDEKAAVSHTTHPDAQWFPQAGLGLFIHWGIASVKAMNISWPMIPGRALAVKRLPPDEIARIIRESDYNLKGKPNEITPNEYWAMAKEFNPAAYNPDLWLKAAAAAKFQYAVLTARHHEGFALWPSRFGDFDTKTYLGGRDLIGPYIEACRANGLKVGLYYSPPNWYFDRDYMTFLYYKAAKTNPDLPPLGPDLKPRSGPKKTSAETAAHQAAYAELVRGQITELLTRYGKIDLLWFDGKPPIPNGANVITPEEIRALQPGIVLNPRLHGKGDFVTFERHLPAERPKGTGWKEFCDPWTGVWSHTNNPFRSNGFVLGELARCRAWGINFLLDVGPMASGEFTPAIYENMRVVEQWMVRHQVAVEGAAHPLPAGESASVPATAREASRFLFAIPEFRNDHPFDSDRLPFRDVTFTLTGVRRRPASVILMGDEKPLSFLFSGETVTIELPANRRTPLVDVVRVELTT